MRPDGLPFGITLIGRCGSDWQLADLGQRFHHATGLPLGATGEPLPAPDAAPGSSARRQREGGGRRRASLGHAAQRPVDRTRRHARARHANRARTTDSLPCPARRRPSPACCAWRPARGSRSQWKSGTCRWRTTAASSRSSPRRWASARLALADGSSVQGFLCEAWPWPRARRTSRTSAAGAPTSPRAPSSQPEPGRVTARTSAYGVKAGRTSAARCGLTPLRSKRVRGLAVATHLGPSPARRWRGYFGLAAEWRRERRAVPLEIA